MTRFALLVALAACATESPMLSEEVSGLSKDDLISDGYTCTKQDPMGARWTCEKCTTVTDAAGSHRLCWSVGCTGHPDGSSECGADAELIGTSGYWLEAEATTRYGSMQTITDDNASSGVALHVAGAGSSRTSFEMLFAEEMSAWLRVVTPSASANSIYIQLDSGPAELFELPVATTWTWVRVPAARWQLAAGTHTLRFYAAEYGVKIDRVLFHADPDFIPVVQTVQAETAGVVAPMQAVRAATVFATGYLWVPNGGGANGLAQLQVSLPYAGQYHVWGRFYAPTEADNSFYVGRFTQPRTAWSVPVAAAWKWSKSGTPLALGTYDVIEFAGREDGTKLDKVVLTNDPDFRLVDPQTPVFSQ